MGRRANGEGTVFRRKSGYWEAQALVTLVNGTKKRVCAGAKTQASARQKLKEILERESNSLPYCETDWTVGQYLDYWMDNVQTGRVAATTLTSYRRSIKNHLKPTVGNLKLKQLGVADVRMALRAMDERGCKGSVKQKSLQILAACLGCAMREELIMRNVAQLVEKPKYTPKETAIWSAKQAALFLKLAKRHPLYIAFLLLLTYGMRRGEVIGLRWRDIDFENNEMHVRQQLLRLEEGLMACILKTENSRRVLPLEPKVRAALLEYAAKNGTKIEPFNPVFELSTEGTVVLSEVGTPLEPRNLVRCFHLLAKKYGLPRIKLHALRHVAATLLKEGRVPVKDAQLILGHADISTTMRIYQHGTSDTQRAGISMLENYLLGETVAA